MEALVLFILIGLVAGWLGGTLGSGGFGVLGGIVVGVFGAVVGGYLFGNVGIGNRGLSGKVLVGTAGAVLLISVLRLSRWG
ncbi:MAG TPA: GlsB/YeaQ/YmgE family stress response membrane protein [Humidesulfovibrio sp.]|uniref:GlsB/YeaQ/YmgE family stress response membrane protein n=1 Tax=Humidesulfovibrio sp. TaxID=2910988 RepID=UPI002BD495A4|nr:GlsB/YeaQ/YmgE family stress response membrane protein [Humidesulfovibrio sp.]HWR03591.1 GlsB/YeaQ/YmgE family stress response membrane protein [Humidesulfovibrio sp.]